MEVINLKDIIKNLDLDEEYKKLTSLADTNLYETCVVLGELLNPDHAFEYTRKKDWCFYDDTMGNKHFVRMAYMPTKEPFFELKSGWFDENGKAMYDPPHPPNSTAKDWDKRSDTLAKVFRDEFIPFFLEQDLTDTMKLLPLDISRYQVAIRMVNKFTPKDKIEIIENKPTEIVLKKIK